MTNILKTISVPLLLTYGGYLIDSKALGLMPPFMIFIGSILFSMWFEVKK